jgi:phosphonate transport system permease protein
MSALHSAPVSWRLRPCFAWRSGLLAAVLLALLGWSAQRVELPRMLGLIGEAGQVAIGLREDSQVAAGLARIGSGLWPIQISETRSVDRLDGLDRAHLPFGAHIDSRVKIENRLDPQTLETSEERIVEEVLVEPVGYLLRVLGLMLETIEIALWGTAVALLLALPLTVLGARNLTPHGLAYHLARGGSSLLRSIPDLIAALFLVLAFGFGPMAGVLALGLHTAGYLGKVFADDLENAPRGPQDALRAIGCGRLVLLRHALLPQVLPSYLGYLQYILERNIRTATVIGVVGAGGIGQELKGRFEMFDFAHVGTMLLVIFLTVVLLEAATARWRRRMIG